MKSTEQVATRDKERTRRAILDAAEQLFTERGSKASLADIAAAAGVTQSGLRHHFPHRESLIKGVIEHSLTRTWAEVNAHVDLSENRPGKFTRGYIRALTGDNDYLMRLFSPTGLLAALGDVPGNEEIYRRDAEYSRAAFAADGLPLARVLAIRSAAEGLAMAAASQYVTAEELALTRAELLAMTEQP